MKHQVQRRGGYVLPAVLLFLLIAFGVWAIVFRSAATSLRMDVARSHRAARSGHIAPAAAAGLRLLQTGMPPSDPYTCKLALTQDGATRYYRLTFAKVGETRWTMLTQASDANDATAEAPATFLTPPEAPGDLVAVALSGSQIKLTWSDVYYDNGYQVERSADGDSGWAVVANVGRNGTTVIDDGLVGGMTYYYRIRGVNAAGAGVYSAVVAGVTP